jgi:hypothetical protein
MPSFNIANALAKIKQLEAEAPGFLAALDVNLKNVESSKRINYLLSLLNSSLAAEEQTVIKDLEIVVEVSSSDLSLLLPYADQLIALLVSLAPGPSPAPIVPPVAA